MNSPFVALMVALPLAGAAIAYLLHDKKAPLKTFATLLFAAFMILPIITSYGVHVFGGHTTDAGFAKAIEYVFAPHSRLLIFTLALIAYLAASSYTGAYERLSGPYLAFMMLLVASVSAVLLADDLFNMYVFLEVALISQTALALSAGTDRANKASLKYLIAANVAGNCFLLSVALIYSFTGSLNLADIQGFVSAHGARLASYPVFLFACTLSVFSWTYVSGLFPFHNVKSELYAAARSHASALMQASTKLMLVAVGIVLLKVFYEIAPLRVIMLYVSLLAMVFGVVMALKQDNYQRMLSYHAISQAGYVACGLSIGTPVAVAAAIFHAFNNALYKSALFLGCECVQNRTGTADFKGLGGLVKSMPYVAFLVFLAKLAISGIPPFNGFQSKLSLMVSAFDAGLPEVTAIMLLVSVLTFISMMKAFHMAYMRKAPEDMVEEGPKPQGTYVAALSVLVCASLIVGLFPDTVMSYLEQLAYSVGYTWR